MSKENVDYFRKRAEADFGLALSDIPSRWKIIVAFYSAYSFVIARIAATHPHGFKEIMSKGSHALVKRRMSDDNELRPLYREFDFLHQQATKARYKLWEPDSTTVEEAIRYLDLIKKKVLTLLEVNRS